MEQTCTCLQNQNTAGRSNFRSLSIGSVPLSSECCLISQSLCQELDSAELTDMTVPCATTGEALSLGSSGGDKRLCLLRCDLFQPLEKAALLTVLLLNLELFWTPLRKQPEKES